ncbi:MAG: HAD family hydrolase [Thermoanaerobaculum sp.]|nr:HAD family hydrolase [Thermoanaerobaculum sp.]MDW7966542.1 HAD family hydrolase [Thermoanaerobaculum sp.]
MRPQAVIFDMDGTLADSFASIAQSLNHALVAKGFPPKDLQWVKYNVGFGARQLVQAAVGSEASEELLREVGQLFGEHYQATYLEATPPLPGAGEVLAFVWAKTGGKVAVASNKYATLSRRWLAHWHLDRWVPVVVGPDTAGTRKPDGAFLAKALTQLQVAPEDALYVGDMEVDVEAGRAAEVPVVGLAGPSRSANELWAAGAFFVISDLRELPPLLQREGWGWEDADSQETFGGEYDPEAIG